MEQGYRWTATSLTETVRSFDDLGDDEVVGDVAELDGLLRVAQRRRRRHARRSEEQLPDPATCSRGGREKCFI